MAQSAPATCSVAAGPKPASGFSFSGLSVAPNFQSTPFPNPTQPSSSTKHNTTKHNKGSTTTNVNQFFFSAVSFGDLALLKRELANGADINAQDATQRTALHHAVLGGSTSFVEYLLENGANTEIKDRWGNTSLHLAIKKNQRDIAKLLVEHNADTNCKDNTGSTALMAAVCECQELTRYLLEKGANVNAKCDKGITALLSFLKWQDRSSEPALSIFLSTIETLFEFGADVNVAEETNENTPLHLAITLGNYFDVTALLLKIGADPKARNRQGLTPLCLAIEKDLSLTKLIIGYEVNINNADINGNTPLLHSIQNDPSFSAALLVIDHGADVNHQNKNGETPLMAVVESRSCWYQNYLVALLLFHGANPTLRNGNGQLPRERAIANGKRKEVIEMIAEYERLWTVWDLWEMDSEEVQNYVQWLPREMVVDTLDFIPRINEIRDPADNSCKYQFKNERLRFP